MRTLLDHQQKALDYCRSTPFPALFMEMRLGKTKVVIEWLRKLKGKILVVCPLSTVRSSWAEELALEGEPVPALLLGSTKERMEAFSTRRKWNIINFEGLSRCPDLLKNYRWDAIVVDESTRIKNPKAQITRLLVNHRQSADRRCILSGYPAPEGPLDYFEQFRFLHGGFLGFTNFWAYRNVGFFPLAGKFNWVPKPGFKDRIRASVQSKAFVLSRKEVGIGNRKFYEKRTVEMDPAQKKAMEKLEDEFVLEVPGEEEKSTVWAPVKFTWMARLAGGFVDEKLVYDGKIKELRTILTSELAAEQVVVWFRFNAELHAVATELRKRGVSLGEIDGGTPEEERARLRLGFKNGHVRVLLIQQKVGMFGLDLSSASTSIYFSNSYSSEHRVQSEDRIEHPKKKEPLLIIDLVARDSIDEDVVSLLRRKRYQNDYYLLRDLAEAVRRRQHGRTSRN